MSPTTLEASWVRVALELKLIHGYHPQGLTAQAQRSFRGLVDILLAMSLGSWEEATDLVIGK